MKTYYSMQSCYRLAWLVAVVVLLSVSCGTLGAASLPVSSGELTDVQKKALNDNEYDSIVKTGAGTVTLEGIKTFAGSIEVNGGTVIANADGLGTTACVISVADGATLRLNMNSGDRKITIAGSGVDDATGALYLDSSKEVNLKKLYLAAAAKIVSSPTGNKGGLYINGTLEMGGHELTVKNDSMLYFGPKTISNPADIRIVGEDFLCPTASLPTSNGHKFIFNQTNVNKLGRQGVTLYCWKAGFDSDWGLEFNDSLGKGFTSGAGSSVLMWSGDIVIASGVTKKFETVATSTLLFRGDISGAGTFSKQNNGCEFGFYGDNRNLGKMTGAGGTMRFMNVNSMPSSFTKNTKDETSGCIVVLQTESDDNVGGWTTVQVNALLRAFENVPGATVRIGVGDGRTVEFPYTYNPVASFKAGRFGVQDDGVLCMSGEIAADTAPVFSSSSGGRLLFKDTSASPSSRSGTLPGFTAGSGEVAFENAGYVYSSANIKVGEGTGLSVLSVGTNSTVGGYITASTRSRFNVAGTENNVGVLKIGPGASVTNCLDMGNGSNAAGAVHQNGGSFDCFNAAGFNAYWGGTSAGGSYAYYGLADGQFKLHGFTALGWKTGNTGVIDIRGGAFTLSGKYLQVGMAGTGTVYQTGGAFSNTSGNPLTLCDASYDSDYSGGCGVYTISGSQSSMDAGYVLLAGRSGGVGVFNVNGGAEVTADTVGKATTKNETTSTALSGNAAYVNINGGVIRYGTKWSGNEIFGPKVAAATERGSPKIPDRVTIYEGGAVFDTGDDYYACLSAPLSKPTGKSVRSIPLPSDMPSTFIGAPLVSIYSTTGVGATAAADFDPISGAVTNITVTSGGWGYEDAHVVIQRGGVATTWAFDLEPSCFSEVADGGIVKRGKSELRVDSVCDFAGPVVIEEGTLTLMSAGSFASTVVRMTTNATFNVNNGSTCVITDLTGGGTIAGADVAVSGSWHLTTDGCVNAKNRLTVADKTVLAAADGFVLPATGLVIARSTEAIVLEGSLVPPQGFKCRLSADAKVLSLKPERGLVMVIR